MAKYSRLHLLNTMVNTGLILVLYNGDVEVASNIIEACCAGGIRCFQFTNRGDQAHIVFGELARRFYEDDQVILGAGSVIDPAAEDWDNITSLARQTLAWIKEVREAYPLN